MKTSNAITAVLALSLLAGCGLLPDRKPVDYKNGGTPAPALEVPPDLTLPGTSQRYAIPAADGTQVASYSDYSRDVKEAEQPSVAPVPAPVVATEDEPARLMSVEGQRFVLLSEPFDRAWRKVGLALERAKIATGDVNRSKGVFYLKTTEKQPSELRVLVQETKGVSVVTVSADAVAKAEATRILDILFTQLEK
ncbi:MAG: outer membrane protein assembly factor BamC [Gammaproteobacteria bacterium]|nr:outer membrane protein assembly factor BamC [Gammaproteobacteria bacterium]MBU1625610.1 outer membrane protein assembly factor BamC [Gammaproteobacteria bacterium]MBU1980870.1 outer membrane protein assembly factor BamC [Gammaproteobacteria bacterium]